MNQILLVRAKVSKDKKVQFAKLKIILASGFILVLVLLVLYFLLDPIFIKSSLSSEGIGFDSLEKSATLRRKLDEQGTPYAIKKNEDGVQIYWDKKDSQENYIDQLAGSYLVAKGYTGLCFLKDSEPLINKLIASNINHSISEHQDETCVNWLEKDDVAVQEVYSNLKQIRMHQKKLNGF